MATSGKLIATLDPAAEIVEGGERIKRGHTNGPSKVAVPAGWLDAGARETLDTDVADDGDVMALSGG